MTKFLLQFLATQLKIVTFLLVALSSTLGFCAEKAFYAAPSQLPNTDRHMQTAGFWIKRHPSVDKILLTEEKIAAFNTRVQNELKLTKDIFSLMQNFQTEPLMANFEKTLKDLAEENYCTAQGVRQDRDFWDRARRNMNIPNLVLGVAPRYGLVVRYTDVRFLPTAEGLYESPGDFDFDQLQNSTLDVGSAVAIVHQSADKKWYYVLSQLADGWVQVQDIAAADAKTVEDFVQNPKFAVVTSAKAEIFLDEAMTDYHEYARMGARLPLVGQTEGRAQVLVPVIGKENGVQIVPAYVEGRTVHEGFLPFSARTIYRQAFAMLNQPYGWGGMYGRQDCSAFLDEVFATVGIILPRDSKNQAQVGKALAEFEDKTPPAKKMEVLKAAAAGATILPMKGHILLYLGMADGRPYAIHAVWAYRERKGDRDIPRVINRVVVSDLDLGEGSQKGSLLKRLTKIVELK